MKSTRYGIRWMVLLSAICGIVFGGLNGCSGCWLHAAGMIEETAQAGTTAGSSGQAAPPAIDRPTAGVVKKEAPARPSGFSFLRLLEGLVRGSDQLREMVVGPDAKYLRLELENRTGQVFREYRAILQAADGQKSELQSFGLQPKAVNARRNIVLTVPIQQLGSGEYSLTLMGITPRRTQQEIGEYHFVIRPTESRQKAASAAALAMPPVVGGTMTPPLSIKQAAGGRVNQSPLSSAPRVKEDAGSGFLSLSSRKVVTEVTPANQQSAFAATYDLQKNQYRVQAGERSVALSIRLEGLTEKGDVDLAIRYGKPVEILNGRLICDYKDESPANDLVEWTITGQSKPQPLQAGPWYIAIGNGASMPSGYALTANAVDATGDTEEITLQVDDGSFECNLGFSNGAENAYFVNRLTPAAYPATLKSIQLYFAESSGLSLYDPIDIIYAAHPSGSTGINGVAFSRFSSFVGYLDEFNSYRLDTPLTITGGDFIVGMRLKNLPKQYPMAHDTDSSSKQRSYYSTNGSSFYLIDDQVPDFAGNFGIRAGVSSSAPSGGCKTQRLTIPASLSGALAMGDCLDGVSGPWYYTDRYSWQAQKGSQLTIAVKGQGFQPYVYLLDPAGNFVDEQGDDSQTTLQFTANMTSSGAWELEVSSWDVFAVGSYQLSITSSTVPPPDDDGNTRKTNKQPVLNRVDVTRIVMAHGRSDGQRGGDISSLPGMNALLAAINGQPNPLRITLDTDGDGKANTDSPIVLASAPIPSCFTLAVAEGQSDPDGDPIVTRWDQVAVRNGRGNLYATVPIPAAGITAGMELVTFAHINAYTANSILFESPTLGTLVVDEMQDGGTESVTAQTVDVPPAPLSPAFSGKEFGAVEYARTIRAVIMVRCLTRNANGSFTLGLRADLPARSFETLNRLWLRWGIEGSDWTIIRDMAATNEIDVIIPEREEGKRVKISVMASSVGAAAAANVNPFVNAAGGDRIQLDTFATRGAHCSDTETVEIKELNREICGDGLDNDCDGQVDEGCNFQLFVNDNQCQDDTIGVNVDGQRLGETPLGKGRFFDLSSFSAGEHTLDIIGIASGGEMYGCAAAPIVSYGVSLLNGVQFVSGGTSTPGSTADIGEINVGAQVRYRIRW